MSGDSNDTKSKVYATMDKVLILRILSSSKAIDLIFGVFCLYMIIQYLIFIPTMHVPIWDGSVYLLNAHEWLTNSRLTENFRPPLFSWIIDAIWIFTGEDWTAIKYVQMIFTVAGIVLLYVFLRKRKSPLFAFGVSVLTLTNAQFFYYTSQLLTEGISFFFLILTMYSLEERKSGSWLLSGVSIGLTFAARYPILLQALVLFTVQSILRGKSKSTFRTAVVAICLIMSIIVIMYAKTGLFEVGGPRSTNFGITLSSYYIVNAISIWGPAILLLPVSFLFKSTIKENFNYIYISWFIISLIFFSANTTNHQYRFMIQFMPAAYFLVMLTVENTIRFNKENLIFMKNKKENSDA